MITDEFFKTCFLKENKAVFAKTIAIIAGSYKPPTAAHWNMIEQYAKKADEVVVLISDPKSSKSIRKTITGTVITALMSKNIFDIYIKAYSLLKKVIALVSPEPSPITAAFKYIDENLNDVNVILGVSKKGGDESRFKSVMKYYDDNAHINLIDPMSTAVEPFTTKDGRIISATDVRNNINNVDAIKELLPEKLSDSDVDKVILILNNGKQVMTNDSEQIQVSLDETEDAALMITDDILKNSKIAAYNVGQVLKDPKTNKNIPVNPKKFPNNAITVLVTIGGIDIVIFFNTVEKKWDSDFTFEGKKCKLSPEQMGQFFNSEFYQKLILKLKANWPLSDKFYSDLYIGICRKEMLTIADNTIDEDLHDKSMSNKDVTGDDIRDYTASGRKIVNFSDNLVSSKGAKFFCWPDEKKAYRWSSWKDWKKIKPLCRLRFMHNGIPYGMSLSTLGTDQDFKHRGFRGYSLDPRFTPVQWLSKEENESLMKLSIILKFVSFCTLKILKYVSKDAEDILKEINSPDKITLSEIRKTLACIRRTLNEVIKEKRIDDFKWD